MSEPVRDNSKIKEQIAEITKIQIVILKAIAEIESQLEIEVVAPGEYHGLSFE